MLWLECTTEAFLLNYIAFLQQQQLTIVLDKVEQNIVICQWQADQLFAKGEG